MIRKIKVTSCVGILALVFSSAPSFAVTILGDTANVAQLTYVKGVLDFNQMPDPVVFSYTDQNYSTNANGTINQSISDGARTASVNVTPGVIKAYASSAGLLPGYYLQGAQATGGFIDTFSVATSAPGQDWATVTFRLHVDGHYQSNGSGQFFNRGVFVGFFDLTTATGGQRNGSIKRISGFQLFPSVTESPCAATAPGQDLCSLGRIIASNDGASFDGYEFRYTATVKTNQEFTLQVGMAAAAFTLNPNEVTISDFASTGIFGGIDVGDGFTVTSLAAGGTLGMRNGIANYDAAFAALTDKYGSATPGAVPEPGIWAMMIAGFAMAGGLMRRRPKAAARVSII